MSSQRPAFSIVCVVHDGERQLPDFFRSVERQTVAPTSIEVVAVDDASGDGSSAALGAWSARARFRVMVLSQPSPGRASARNAGLRRATGEWVMFTDPDALLAPDFLAAAGDLARVQPGVEVLGAGVATLDEAGALVADRKPGRAQDARRPQGSHRGRVVDLEREPTVLSGRAPLALFRHERLREQRLEFEDLRRPAFEDRQFLARFILNLDRPLVGLLQGARYVRRAHRADEATLPPDGADRLLDTAFLHGCLDLVGRARASHGRLPDWIQHLLVAELIAVLRSHDRTASRVDIPRELAPRFHELMGEVCRALNTDLVARHTAPGLRRVWVEVIANAYRDPGWRPASVDRTSVDTAMQLQRVTYRYTGETPAEEIRVDDRPVAPAFSKVRPVSYFHRAVLSERILWLPAGGDLSLRLDGRPMAFRDAMLVTDTRARPRGGSRSRLQRLRAEATVLGASSWRRLQRLLARTVYRQRFRNAWVLSDRIHDADDNGERLFEYLRRERPDINAWFVLDARSEDWARLRTAGERRLVAHGSFEWKMLMLNASWLLSSHTDLAMVRPRLLLELVGTPTWRYGFLQHGVTTSDLSRWFNERPIDLLVVSTEAELAAVADDGSSYALTRKEARLTGLPRFDRLLEKGRETPAGHARLVLVAPTWRTWLILPLARDGSRKVGGDFLESEYARCWLELLRSPEIADAVRGRGWRLGFMPHPNLRSILAHIDLPDHVEPLAYAGNDVQGLFAQCALLVTDYSSVAFNAAYLDRPAVYYQFDRTRFADGEHLGRPGYFEWDLDGFGPVATNHDAAVAAIVAAIERGPQPAPKYLARIARTFPQRDGGACARVVVAVEEMGRPWVGPPGG